MNLFFNETGYKVKVVEKEMVQDETLVEGDTESYECMKSNFEADHFKNIISGYLH